MSAVFRHLNTALTEHQSNFTVTYLLLLFGLFFTYLMCIPVQYHDTDMWYHLAGGRHFLENFETYNPYVASYLTPEQPFINYFWGFQVSAYSIWSLAGEPGLIVYKAIAMLLAGLISTKVILADKPFPHANILQLIAITLIIGMLCTRSVSLRPHVGSYVFIPLFIYILMFRERWCPVLPVLAIIWANFHGVEWIIGALICGAFVLERSYRWWRSKDRDMQTIKPLIWPVLCAPAILVSPNGWNLLLTPFVQDPNIWMFVTELQPFAPDLILDIDQGATRFTLFWLLAAVTAYALIQSLDDVQTNLAPLLLAAGGILLLSTAGRFSLEWALLSTAIIARQVGTNSYQLNAMSVTFTIGLLIAITSAYLPTTRKGLHYYPMDRHSLPYGTTEFIKRNNIQGRYAIAPSHAGYIEFERPAGIKVHMDMHFPPFTADVFHELLTAMISSSGLEHYVQKHEPDLFGVDRSNEYFAGQTIRDLGYAPVFFDRRIALFVHRGKHPDIADRFELGAIDPMNDSSVRADQIEQGISELERMLKVVDIPPIKETLAGFLIETGQLDRAAVVIEQLRSEQGDRVTTHYLSARLAHLTNRCDIAIPDYEIAIASSGTPEPMHLMIAECYFVTKQPDKAYEHFSQGLNPYRDSQPNPLTYYQFALAALSSGHEYEAIQLLKMIPRIDTENRFTDQARDLLDDLTTTSP